jgi:GT2 family glycosyltransferase
MRRIKLAVGLPLSGTQRDDDFWLSFLLMDKPADIKLYVPNIPIGDFGRDIAYIRNDLKRQSDRDGITHLIMMDTDQLYPRDTITKLLRHAKSGKEIVVAPVHRRYNPFELILMRGMPDHYQYISDEEKYSGNLIEIDAAGTGCMMIDLEALKDIPDPWFDLDVKAPSGKPIGEDIGFCWKARQAGHRIWADTSIEIDHIARIRINRAFYEIGKKINRAA